jgi:hypothetical protein
MRLVFKLAAALASLPLTFAYTTGCQSSTDSVTCGPGTTQSGDSCVVSSPSIATADGGASDGPAGTVTTTFAGASGVAPASASSLLVTWDDAKGGTPPARMRYRVFYGPTGAPLDYTKPFATTDRGAHSLYITGLNSGKSYDVAVRALDDADQTDSNTVVKTGTPGLDSQPPSFAGVKSAQAGGSGAVTLTWDAAKDDLTPTASIVYLVYVADETSDIDVSVPVLTTAPGATTVDVTGLFNTGAVHRFVVRARDAADNIDTNLVALPSRPGPDTTPPEFAGCKSAYADTAGSAIVSWEPATDDTTPSTELVYDIYASPDDVHFDFTKPAASQTSASTVTVTGLESNTVWHFICRARDFTGNEDKNVVQRLTKTLTDSTPPTFAGLTTAAVDSLARTATFTWDPGSDDKTAPEQMVYDLYESTKSGQQDFTGPPRASSDPGATTLFVTDLTPDATLYWVIRARDQGGNHDSNTVEANGAISVSFSRQVQAIFSHDCGVAGCHVPGNPVANMILARGFAYQQIVSVKATESTDFRINPGNPDQSYLYKKITMNPPPVGWQMPAPATGSVLTDNEKDLVRRWILQGAVEN